jgi:uncharacterized protein
MKVRTVRLTLIGLAILALFLALRLVGVYVDWLFFEEVAYGKVFLKMLSAEVLTGLAFGATVLVFVLVNVLFVNRVAFPSITLALRDRIDVQVNLEWLNRIWKPLGMIVAAVMAVFGGLWGSGLWNEVLVFLNRVATGTTDPILGKDVSFYLFQLPLYQSLSASAGLIIFLTLAIVILGYMVRGGFLVSGNRLSMASQAGKHVGTLVCLFLVKIAFGFYLDRFELLYSPQGIIVGAGYTQVHVILPVLNTLVVLSVIAGVVCFVALMRGSLRMTLYPAGLLVVAYVLGVVIYPGLFQSFKVAPSEIGVERPFIEHHVAFTKLGYGLRNIEVRPFNVSYGLTGKDIQKNEGIMKNIRLWDEAPLLKTYGQLQQIRTYYRFTSIDNDRYMVNGEYRQVMLSARELSYSDLPSKSWINEKLVFTHGNGVAMGPVSRISREGLPEFIIKDIPPVSNANLKITMPEIYFGELTGDYAVVDTKIPEFSYPTSEGNVYSSYKGKGGVPLNSLFRKAVFASSFGSAKILLSSDITRQSRILYNRNIIERVNKIAPFLTLDSDPYIVVSDQGKLFWIIDAYTVSTRLPYSKPLKNRVNYMRNSVKVTVDAYNGHVDFYVSDPDDAIIKVYSAVFPGLLKAMAEMPADLRRHIRYPRQLFMIQSWMYATYHMEDPKIFYNKEDLWEIPAYGGKQMEPYYLIMKLPEGKREEYVLLQPYTPSKRDNLAAWFAARCDEPDYGKLVVYTFPRDRLIFGPRQIDARIDQDSYISQQLTLWGQHGSQVIRGSLLIIPIETSLLYIQPLYLAAEDKGGLPELRRVIVAYENTVVMDENLELCLQRLFGERKAVPLVKEAAVRGKASVNELAREAAKVLERSKELQRQGDWAGYGEQLKRLEQVLKEMAAQ